MGLLGVLGPLHGGGFWLAYAQLCTFYYTCGVLLHHIVPAVIPVKSVQHENRRSGSVARDALYSLGEMEWNLWILKIAMHANPFAQFDPQDPWL